MQHLRDRKKRVDMSLVKSKSLTPIFLNIALFGLTAKEWRENNPKQDGNIRDYANVEQLIVLSNMESVNAELIKQGMLQADRLVVLNSMAISQMKSLINNPTIKKLGK